MLDRYDTAVTIDAWSVPAVEGGAPASTHVLRFAREHGMDERLIDAARKVVTSAFRDAADLLGPVDGHVIAVNAATDGQWLAVRIAGVAAMIELPMTADHTLAEGPAAR